MVTTKGTFSDFHLKIANANFCSGSAVCSSSPLAATDLARWSPPLSRFGLVSLALHHYHHQHHLHHHHQHLLHHSQRQFAIIVIFWQSLFMLCLSKVIITISSIIMNSSSGGPSPPTWLPTSGWPTLTRWSLTSSCCRQPRCCFFLFQSLIRSNSDSEDSCNPIIFRLCSLYMASNKHSHPLRSESLSVDFCQALPLLKSGELLIMIMVIWSGM